MTGYFGPVSNATYMVLTTFRRSGEPVRTPVHVVTDAADSIAYFRTWEVSGKAKRLHHTAEVEIAPSTIRGRPTGATIRARAQLLEGQASQRAAQLIAARHPVLHGRLIPWWHRRRGWVTQQYQLHPLA